MICPFRPLSREQRLKALIKPVRGPLKPPGFERPLGLQ
jgi:hypothetical protein